MLAYLPDRLSRKYANQILLMEEFARQEVETLFMKAPQGDSAEDRYRAGDRSKSGWPGWLPCGRRAGCRGCCGQEASDSFP